MRLLSFILFFISINFAYSQCPNDVCETAIELSLCNNQPLSENCITDFGDETIQLAGNVTYPGWAIGYDHWYSITITEFMQVSIVVESDYSHPLATWSSSFGWNEGIRFIMWYGDSCDNLTPVLYSQSTIGSGQYCGANEYTQNPCLNPLPNWTCPDCLDQVDIGGQPYIGTLLARPQCCNGWTNQCQSEYNSQVIFYNTAMSAWNWQNGLGPIDGLCPFDPTVQNIELFMTLMPGTYWFQVFPFENTQAGYVSEGTGFINICGLFFLNLEYNEESNEYESEIEIEHKEYKNRFKKIIHPLYGFLIYDTFRDKYYDVSMREIKFK